MSTDSTTRAEYLRRIARAVEARRVGLVDKPPGRRVLFANVVKAPDGCLWYEWNRNEQKPIAVQRQNVRGRLTDCFVYEKASGKGTTLKVRIALDCGLTTYEIETSLYNVDRDTLVTSGKMLAAGLYAGIGAVKAGRMITVGARPAEEADARDQVLFLDVYTDDGKVRYDQAPDTKAQAISMLSDVRAETGNPEDLFDNPIANRSEPHEPNESRPNGGREQHPSERVYDGGQGNTAPPQQGTTPAEEGRSAANPSGDPRTSGTATSAQNGDHRTPVRPLPEAHSAVVACPACGAEPNEACFDPETGEQTKGHHDMRVTFAEGLAGDAEKLLEIIEPHLKRRDGAELKQAITDLGERAGLFPDEEWEIILDRVTPYHDEAESILNSFRNSADQ